MDLLKSKMLESAEAKQLLKAFVDAYDANQIAIDSPEIQTDGEPPYAWHEEWLHYARNIVGKP